MNNIDHNIDSEVATDGARRRLFGVCRTNQSTNAFHSIFRAQGNCYDGRGLHERNQFRKERFVGQMRVMLFQQRIVRFEHAATADLKSVVFKTLDDFANFSPGYAIGLQQYEGGFHERGIVGDPCAVQSRK